MKRIIYIATSIVLLTFLSSDYIYAAEKEGRKKNSEVEYYGAAKGDFAMSFSALPILNFVGNMFNGTTAQSFTGLSSLTPNIFSGTTLSAKYFVSRKMSLTLGAGFNCIKNESYSYLENELSPNEISTKGTNEFMLMFGANYLLRPGKRLQPVLGANIMYALSNKDYEKYDDMSEVNSDTDHSSPKSTFGLICNVGVEYFLCRSISLSALLDLGLTTGKTRTKVSDWDEEYSRVNTSQTKFMTGKMGGNLAINFYF